jgi:hypothetical protein
MERWAPLRARDLSILLLLLLLLLCSPWTSVPTKLLVAWGTMIGLSYTREQNN